MGTVAKGAIGRGTATAQSEGFFAFQVECVSGCIGDRDWPGDEKRSVVFDYNFNISHQ
jgi:hypothetical protein